jgi:hypothetical protein
MDKHLVFNNEKKARKRLAKLTAYGKIAYLETRRKYDKNHDDFEKEYIIIVM